MNISYNWLKQYVSLEQTPAELANTLTMGGLEVEGAETTGNSLEGVVIGHVLEVRPHPNADRLTLCDVDLGSGEPTQIVCGAPNVAAGQKVPVATVGTTLLLPSRKNPAVKEPFTLTRAKIRGEVSEGMICAEDELGLSDDHSGIMVLDEDAEVGQAFSMYLEARGTEVQDTVLDVSLTPNRPDAASHIGIARDVAVLTGMQLVVPTVELPETGSETAKQVAVKIEAPEACPRYAAMIVRGVRIQESPEWLKRRLTAIGLRPRNNVVDVTNYVMYECGQPLHAFDLDQIAGSTIVVRLSKENEPFRTLDSRDWKLPEGTLLICDAERPVAIAGIMGGENSEVTDETVNVLIESAYFDPSTIRRAAKALGLQTDSSYRFERGVDSDGQVWAAARAAGLIAQLGGGEIVPGVVDEHPRPIQKRQAAVRISRIKKVLGVEVPVEDVYQMLKALGFEVQEENPLDVLAEHALEGRSLDVEETEFNLQCTIPTFRPDIEREIDIIEEIARVYGYHRIPEPEHSVIPNVLPETDPAEVLRNNTRVLLKGLGYREIYTNSMLPRETAGLFNDPVLGAREEEAGIVETLNPISQEMAALRPSLLPGMLQVMGYNQNHGQRILRFFEFGHVFRRTKGAGTYIPGYIENEAFLIGLSGQFTEPSWDLEERNSDFFDIKGAVELILHSLRVTEFEAVPVYDPTNVTSYHLVFRSGGTDLGIAAKLSDEVAERYELKTPAYFAEFDWQRITELAAPRMQRRYSSISRYPVVDRDLAVVVNREQPVGVMIESIRQTGKPLLRDVSVFDLYEGERIERDKKSIAFALRFGADRTLQDEEVDQLIARILEKLQRTYGADLRA